MEMSISHPEEPIKWLWLIAAAIPPLICFILNAIHISQTPHIRRWGVLLFGCLVGPVVLVSAFMAVVPEARADFRGAVQTFAMLVAVSGIPIVIASELLRRVAVAPNSIRPLRFSLVAAGTLVVGAALTLGGLIALSIGLDSF